MAEPAITVGLDDDLRRAAARMVTPLGQAPAGSRRLRPLVSIVSRRDVLRLSHRSDPGIALAVERLLADPLSVPDDQRVDVTVRNGAVTLTGSARCPVDVKLIENMVLDVPACSTSATSCPPVNQIQRHRKSIPYI